MPQAALAKTTLSTKGQIVVPKAIRDQKRWQAGTRLVLKDTPEGILITPEQAEKIYTVDDIIGILKYVGPPVTIEQMNEAVFEEAKRQDDRIRHQYSSKTDS
jgi:AbrB family looped-hinge helix DNA binding protein